MLLMFGRCRKTQIVVLPPYGGKFHNCGGLFCPDGHRAPPCGRRDAKHPLASSLSSVPRTESLLTPQDSCRWNTPPAYSLAPLTGLRGRCSSFEERIRVASSSPHHSWLAPHHGGGPETYRHVPRRGTLKPRLTEFG